MPAEGTDRMKTWVTALTGTLAVLVVLLCGMFAYGVIQMGELNARLDTLEDGLSKTGYTLKDFNGVMLSSADRLDYLVTSLDETKAAVDELHATIGNLKNQIPPPQSKEPGKLNSHMSIIQEFRARER
ncbi:MAG: hypothetical protein CMM50_09610 [Rhodospirillaceae bacterium]|nr:hypothetical protein [Rhodospirillaceae bacterium]|tara:strand:- start:258 stop:641 length:384 start_codon:yes stop_codon:yes gene_type:complete